MTVFDQVAWLPLCAGLTVLGLIISWLVGRRRGWGAGLRGVAWSLLPVAAYLIGIIELLWQISSSVARWAAGFVISLTAWAGIAVIGLSIVLFIVSGVIRRRAPARSTKKAAKSADASGPVSVTSGSRGQTSSSAPASSSAGSSASSGDDEFAEIEEILRRRGIQ